MWKEWAKKVKTFAEDITSPDYDEERRDDGDGDNEDNDAKDVSDRRIGHAPQDEIYVRQGGSRGAYRAQHDGPSLLLETPARRLEKHYDEPTVVRPVNVTATPAAAQQQPAAQAQLTACVRPTVATSTITFSAVKQQQCHAYEESEDEEKPESDASSSTSAQRVNEAGGSYDATNEVEAKDVTSPAAAADAATAPRCGPPMAMRAHHHHQQDLYNRSSQLHNAADAAAASSLSTDSAAPGGASPADGSSTAVPQTGVTAPTLSTAVPASPAADHSAVSTISSTLYASSHTAPTSATPPTSHVYNSNVPATIDDHAGLPNTSTSVQQQQQQLKRIAELEAANAQMLTEIRNYQEEVRMAHEQTVAYYEAQLSTARCEASDAAAAAANAANAESAGSAKQQLESFRVALRTAEEKLDHERATKAALQEKVDFLELEMISMKANVKKMESLGTVAPVSSDTNVRWAEKEKECTALEEKLRHDTDQRGANEKVIKSAEATHQSFEEQLSESNAQFAALQASAAAAASTQQQQNTDHSPFSEQYEEKLVALQDELNAWKARAEGLEEKLTAAQQQSEAVTQQLVDEQTSSSTTAAHNFSSTSNLSQAAAAEVVQLKQQLQSAESVRSTLETQLYEAQAELMAVLTANTQDRSTVQKEQEEHAQELADMRLQLETAQQQAAELTHQLTMAHEQTDHLRSQLAAQESLAASSRTVTSDEVKRLNQKLEECTSQSLLLETEVQQGRQTIEQLTSRLKAETQAHHDILTQVEKAHAEADAVLEDEVSEVKANAAKDKQRLEEQLQKLRAELQQAQKRAAQCEEESNAAVKARGAAEAKATSTMEQYTALESEKNVLCQQVRRYKDDLAKQQQELQRLADKEANSGASISIATLTNVKRELEEEVQTLKITMDQVRRMIVDTLVRLGVDIAQTVQQQSQQRGGSGRITDDVAHNRTPCSLSLPQNGTVQTVTRSHCSNSSSNHSSEEDEEGTATATQRQQRMAQDKLPLLQLLSLLTTECTQQHGIVLRTERVQQEWEKTYEQARQVNASLNQQVADAWATIGKLREDISVKDAAAREMQSRVGAGDARLLEMQEEMVRITAELQQLKEERESWAAQLQQAEGRAEGQEQNLVAVEEELQSLQTLMQAKDEELLSSQQSLVNLQMVLDRFQETKRHDVEALTLETHLEAEGLKRELEVCKRIVEHHEQEKVELRENFESQLATKDAEVTTLYRKLAELRKVFENTTSQHIDGTETSVDKRVVSQLLAKYIHAFIGQRKEAEDMLKVLSGLLDWDEATQELAGLLPGPNNPHPPGSSPNGQKGGSGGGRSGLFGWRKAKPAATTAAAAAASQQGPAGAPNRNSNTSGLASMWVEFLLKESEGGNSKNGGAVTVSNDVNFSAVGPATPSAPGGASISGATVSGAFAATAASTATPAGL